MTRKTSKLRYPEKHGTDKRPVRRIVAVLAVLATIAAAGAVIGTVAIGTAAGAEPVEEPDLDLDKLQQIEPANVSIGEDENDPNQVYDRLGDITINTVEQNNGRLLVELTNDADTPETIGIVQVGGESIIWDTTRLLPGENSVLAVDLPADPSSNRPIAYVEQPGTEVPFTALVPPSSSTTLPIYQGVGAGLVLAFGATVLAARKRLDDTGEPEIDRGE